MEEIWKDIEGYEGLYKVSNLGRVKSINRIIEHKRLGTTTVQERILSAVDKGLGYMVVGLSKGGKRKTMRVHRLVAKAFIPNPKNFDLINHKDKNTSNNNVSKLEWCDYQYNNTYADHNELSSKSLSKPVLQYTMNGKFVARYYGAVEAEKKTGICRVCIRDCCRGKLQSSGGFRWKLESDNKDMSVPLFRKSRSKLSYDDVVKIKQMAKDGIKQKGIAKSIGTSLHTVNNIVRGYCFKDV